jgi:hypothetical protein
MKKHTAMTPTMTTTNPNGTIDPYILNIARRIKQQKTKQPRIVISVLDDKVRSKVEKFLHSNDISFEVKGLPKLQQVDPALEQALVNYKNLTGVEFKSKKDETVQIRSGQISRLQAVLNRTQEIKDALAVN